MAYASTPDEPINDESKTIDNIPKSHFQKTVCLADWWLVKTENDPKERGLGVAGFNSREQGAIRVFSSAPILKRFEAFTLETTDGISVIIKGLINKTRTQQNGFSDEVFKHFLFGFPPYWKEYAEKCIDLDSPYKDEEADGQSQDPMDVDNTRKSKNSEYKTDPLPPQNLDSGGIMSACHVHGKRRGRKASKNSKKLELDQNISIKSKIYEPKSSANKITSHTTTRSMRKLQKNQKNDRTSGDEKKTKSKSSVKEKPEPNSESLNQKKDQKRVKIKQNANDKASETKSRRKLGYETPGREKEKVPSGSPLHETPTREKGKVLGVSPLYSSCKRSRSGRLLMPKLEFWRNQITLHDADRTIIGIQEEIHPEHPTRG